MSNRTSWHAPAPYNPEHDDWKESWCEHVEADKTLAYMVGCEDDSFGPVARNVCCEPCYRAAKEEEAEEIHTCQDCGMDFPRKQVRMWRWYDFDVAAGDEPDCICGECWEKPKHKDRMARNNLARDEERERYSYMDENDDRY